MSANRVVEKLEGLLKLSGLLAVFGYISLRAHLNYLGISNEDSLTAERYLMETWLWIATTFGVLFQPGVLAIVVLLVWLFCRKKELYLRWFRHSWVGYGVLLVLIVATFLTRIWIGWRGDDLVVGTLQANKFEHFHLDRTGDIDDSGLTLVYRSLCVFCLLAYAFLKAIHTPTGASSVLWPIRQLSFIMLLILSLHIPLVFAKSCDSMFYPIVTIKTTDTTQQPYQGLLVLSNNGTKTIWRLASDAQPTGETLLIPNKQISQVEIGNLVDIRKEAWCGVNPAGCKPPSP